MATTDLEPFDLVLLPPRLSARGRRGLTAVLAPTAAIGIALLIWLLLVWARVRPSYVLPTPGDVARTMGHLWQHGTITQAVWTSVSRAVLGFLASVAIGTPIGLLLGRVRLLRIGVRPLLSGLQSLPSVAWVPAAIIWFGLDNAAIYFVVLMGAVPSIATGLVSGLDQIPHRYPQVGRVLGLGSLGRVRHILLPAALPAYLAGLRQGWAFAWRALMAAELITFSPKLGLGLGQLLERGRDLDDMSLVLTSILVILTVGVAIELLGFAPLERHVLRRRGLLRT